MTSKLIYLDTNVWNAMRDQAVSPIRLVAGLAARNARLVLGEEVIYEMTKLFHQTDGAGLARGTSLFNYLLEYLDREIPLVRVNMEVVAAEMHALRLGSFLPEIFLTPDDYKTTRAELVKLSKGEVCDRIKDHVQRRIESAASIRLGQSAYLNLRPEIKRELNDVSPDELSDWLERQLHTTAAKEHLATQIMEYFPEATTEESREWACALMASPVGRVSKATVRRTLYYNWRCAHFGSVPPDVYFDTNHILNAKRERLGRHDMHNYF